MCKKWHVILQITFKCYPWVEFVVILWQKVMHLTNRTHLLAVYEVTVHCITTSVRKTLACGDLLLRPRIFVRIFAVPYHRQIILVNEFFYIFSVQKLETSYCFCWQKLFYYLERCYIYFWEDVLNYFFFFDIFFSMKRFTIENPCHIINNDVVDLFGIVVFKDIYDVLRVWQIDIWETTVCHIKYWCEKISILFADCTFDPVYEYFF